jgi:phage tail-like protein
MRGLISSEQPGPLGVAAPLRHVVPAVYQEDPLFTLLCESFDDLLAPLVTAVDCFDAYLDPRLAPGDFLPWLADLVGYQGEVRTGSDADREQIAAAVQGHGRRGTALGVREAAARAAGVPVEQVRLDDPGGVKWSAIPGGAIGGWPGQTAARITVTVPQAPGQATEDQNTAGQNTTDQRIATQNADREMKRTTAAVRAAVDAAAGVHCGIAVEVTAQAAQPRRAQPRGARTYGGES